MFILTTVHTGFLKPQSAIKEKKKKYKNIPFLNDLATDFFFLLHCHLSLRKMGKKINHY